MPLSRASTRGRYSRIVGVTTGMPSPMLKSKIIANKIAEGKVSLDELVSQYGYENVYGVLEVLGAEQSI